VGKLNILMRFPIISNSAILQWEPSRPILHRHTKKVSGPGDGLRMQLHVRLLPGTIFPEIVSPGTA